MGNNNNKNESFGMDKITETTTATNSQKIGNTSSYNICIGPKAGENLTTEQFMFILSDENGEFYRRQMDGIVEYEATIRMLNSVVNMYPQMVANQSGLGREALPCKTGNNSTSIGFQSLTNRQVFFPYFNS